MLDVDLIGADSFDYETADYDLRDSLDALAEIDAREALTGLPARPGVTRKMPAAGLDGSPL